jgi:hypothetical protein
VGCYPDAPHGAEALHTTPRAGQALYGLLAALAKGKRMAADREPAAEKRLCANRSARFLVIAGMI